MTSDCLMGKCTCRYDFWLVMGKLTLDMTSDW